MAYKETENSEFIKKVLVIVPHQDDECFVGGTFIYDLRAKGVEVFVLYTTNGDFYPWIKNIRLQEAVLACGHLLVDEEHVIYLGYGNEWSGKKHIYNRDDEMIDSAAGLNRTYGLADHSEYCYQQKLKHNSYNRRNLKNDLKEAICNVFADCIICVDFDSHPDHMAASLLFEEVMRELIVDKEYRPIVLKKFAYGGLWTGKKDFHENPFAETLKPEQSDLNKGVYEPGNPAYRWDDRIRFEVGDLHKRIPVVRTPVFQALKEHKSQLVWYYTLKTVNDDIVFWWRNTAGLQYTAAITATSGDPSYLNDFKYIDSTDIKAIKEGHTTFDHCVWTPDRNDSEKKITIRFQKQTAVRQISFYENFAPDSNIRRLELCFDGKQSRIVEQINHDGSETKILLDEKVVCKEMTLAILDCEGGCPGLTELEIYESEQSFPYYLFPIGKYARADVPKSNKQCPVLLKLDYLSVSLKYLFASRLNPVRLVKNRQLKKYDRIMHSVHSGEN